MIDHSSLLTDTVEYTVNPVNCPDSKAAGIIAGIDGDDYGRDPINCLEVTKSLFINLNPLIHTAAQCTDIKQFHKRYGTLVRSWFNRYVYWVYAATTALATYLAHAAKQGNNVTIFYHNNRKC
eukprot:3139734-Ditylum_brightwellii.AAC.1